MFYIGDEKFSPLGNGVIQSKKTGKKYYTKVHLIDNGLSFPNFAASNDNRSIILSRFTFAIWAKEIPDFFLASIKRLQTPEFQNKIKGLLDGNSFQLWNERINELLKRKVVEFPKYKIVKKLKK